MRRQLDRIRPADYLGHSVIAGPAFPRFSQVYAEAGDGEEIVSATLSFERLYEVLRREYGLVPWQAEQTVEADLPDAMTASALDIPLTAPVLVLTRRTADAAGHVIEFVRSAYRGDRYKMRARLSPPDTTDS